MESTKIKLAIFSRYFGNQFSIDGAKNDLFVNGSSLNNIEIEREVGAFTYLTAKLLLTHLDDLTDEHAEMIANLDVVHYYKGIISKWETKFGTEQLVKLVKEDLDNIVELASAKDLLQSLGYAVSQSVFINDEVCVYSVDDLVEMGIYEIKPKQ